MRRTNDDHRPVRMIDDSSGGRAEYAIEPAVAVRSDDDEGGVEPLRCMADRLPCASDVGHRFAWHVARHRPRNFCEFVLHSLQEHILDLRCRHGQRFEGDAMVQDPHRIYAYTRIQSVAKYLERIGDHATNVGEDVIFILSAKDVRHHQGDSTRGSRDT